MNEILKFATATKYPGFTKYFSLQQLNISILRVKHSLFYLEDIVRIANCVQCDSLLIYCYGGPKVLIILR